MKEKSFINRFVKEPLKEVTGWTWKLSAFGAVVGLALGKAYISLQLAMIAVAANIIHNETARSIQKSTA